LNQELNLELDLELNIQTKLIESNWKLKILNPKAEKVGKRAEKDKKENEEMMNNRDIGYNRIMVWLRWLWWWLWLWWLHHTYISSWCVGLFVTIINSTESLLLCYHADVSLIVYLWSVRWVRLVVREGYVDSRDQWCDQSCNDRVINWFNHDCNPYHPYQCSQLLTHIWGWNQVKQTHFHFNMQRTTWEEGAKSYFGSFILIHTHTHTHTHIHTDVFHYKLY